MKLLVCGGRTYGEVGPHPTPAQATLARAQRLRVTQVLDEIHKQTPIEALGQGGSTGADSLARAWGFKHGVLVRSYYAAWSREGLAAGPNRNERMMREFRPDCVVAFPGGAGTADMTRRAIAWGVYLIRVAPEDSRP